MSAVFPENWANIPTAFSHDWLTGMRGGERVLELMCKGFPNAPVHTLIHKKGVISDSIESHPVHTSWLQQVPGIFSSYRYFLPFFPFAIRSFRPQDVDLVISSSHCVAKGIRKPEGAKHLCYCFTPMRYAWTFYEEYFGSNPLKKMVLQPTLARMRAWDLAASDGVDLFVGISEHVCKRIRKFYDRESELVYPPVDTDRCTLGPDESGDFDLIVSALVPYKRVDLAVAAYNRSGAPLKIVGVGTDFENLRQSARPNIEFLGWKSDEEIVSLYQSCRCLIFPGEEDFGIVPVEAQACGRPVLAYGKGGALETIVSEETGIFFEEQTEQSLLEGVERIADGSWDRVAIRRNAERFSIAHFLEGLDRCIHKCLEL